MADLDFYRQQLGVSSVEDVCRVISDTLIETNHTYDFFVNWSKAIENRDAFKYETALLKSIRNSPNPANELRDLLTSYPEVIRAIPLLLASRDGIVKVLNAIQPDIEYKEIDFSKDTYSSKEISDIVQFTDKTGLLAMLCEMESATDYLLGVEVGLDSNARKNRSGLFLEKMVREVITDLVSRNHEVKWLEQQNFRYVENHFGIRVPESLRNRKFDYVVIGEGGATNIEVNFYGVSGSKPGEIVNSYINRGEVLSSEGWKFVWLTDGMGWRSMQNQLRVGVENIDYVINAYLLRKGLLEQIILTL